MKANMSKTQHQLKPTENWKGNVKMNAFLFGLDFTLSRHWLTGSSEETHNLLWGESTVTVLCIMGASRHTAKHERGKDRATQPVQRAYTELRVRFRAGTRRLGLTSLSSWSVFWVWQWKSILIVPINAVMDRMSSGYFTIGLTGRTWLARYQILFSWQLPAEQIIFYYSLLHVFNQLFTVNGSSYCPCQ